MATKTLPQQRQLPLIRKPQNRAEAEVLLATIAIWIARNEVKEADPRRMWDAVALANKTTAHLIEHRARLRMEAKVILTSTEETL
jgi:hypothetical protein